MTQSISQYVGYNLRVHSNLPNSTPAATKVHVILMRYVGSTWMHDDRELVQHVTLWNNIKSTFQ